MTRWLTLCLVLAAAGCKSIDMKSMDLPPLPWQTEESLYGEPATMIVIWKDAVYTQAGAPPMRGFGGRIYFYDKESKAIPVDGELVIYGFDDSSPAYENQKPQRKFVFTREQFTQRYSETDFGASYSVWLPWEALGGPQRSVTLYPMFTSAGGQLVKPAASTNILPGRSDLSDQQQRGFYAGGDHQQRGFYEGSRQPQSGIQQIGYQDQPTKSGAEDPRRHTSIRLTPAMRERIKAAAAQAKEAMRKAQPAADSQPREVGRLPNLRLRSPS